MHINDERVGEAEAERLLNGVLDAGVNLIDTARGYGLSEERIGRYLAYRRQDFLISTKVGYGIPGLPDWTHDCIVAGVNAALARLRCDYLDIVHLHSCPLHVLEQGDVITALEDCARAGKVGVVAFSGDNAELDLAIQSGRFGSVQTSINLCDQINLDVRLPSLQARGMGVVAKRPIAGAVWLYTQRPGAFAEAQYWGRWQAMGLVQRTDGISWSEVALRFTAHSPGVSCSIVGTTQLAHFKQNLEWIEKGPLPPELLDSIRAAFHGHEQEWGGVI
jgi:aryl-alcohol dehydrogenase-like predicted oxidoreductase